MPTQNRHSDSIVQICNAETILLHTLFARFKDIQDIFKDFPAQEQALLEFSASIICTWEKSTSW